MCQASICRYSWKPNILLHSGPGGPSRTNLTVRGSYDDGKTWPVARVLDLQDSGYSDLAVLPDGSICCLFEAGWRKPIVFAKFSLSWLRCPHPSNRPPKMSYVGIAVPELKEQRDARQEDGEGIRDLFDAEILIWRGLPPKAPYDPKCGPESPIPLLPP